LIGKGDSMNKRSESVLEFDKVKKLLSKYALTGMAEALALKLEAFSDINIVKERLQETSEGVFLIKSGINLPFEGLRDIEDALNLAAIGSSLSLKQLLEISSTMRASRLTKSMWEDKKPEGCNLLGQLTDGLCSFQSIEEKINNAVVSEEEVSDNASSKLYSIRQRKKILSRRIREKLDGIIFSTQYQKMLQEPIVTTRKDRYVVPIKQEYRSSFNGVVHDQSGSGATLYIEPMSVVILNNELTQLDGEEKEEIEVILRDLTLKIKENYSYIKDSFDRLIKLDFIMAKAKYSLDIKGIEPDINANGFINIKSGRHPLLKGEVVPVDIYLGDVFKVLVITGPNTGGKTVTLKTVGLFVFMVQSGLHIPAREGTQMSVFEDIFADIGDEQSIEQSLSTFSGHMKNIKKIVEKSDENCLVLLDELGAGTDPTEGAALAMAILEHFHVKGSKVIATTHYTELKTYAFSKQGVENACVEFDVNTLSPTYKLTIGIPGKSNALEIAERLGLDVDIISLAKTFIAEENLKVEDMLKYIEEEKQRIETQKKELFDLKNSYKSRLEKLEEERQKMLLQRDKILEKARQRGTALLESIKSESQQIISSLKDIEETDDSQLRDRSIQRAKSWLKKKETRLSDEKRIVKKASFRPERPFKLGERVEISGLDQEGNILLIDETAKTAQVQVGIMKINVPLDSLTSIQQHEAKQESHKYSSIVMQKAKDISTELDLRGLTLEEAIAKADKYIDDACLAGVHIVTLIHGKGTGTLRRGIQEMLRKRPNIKSYRVGRFDEGGLGVTVVELR
jgi:DNA mismatch repair protein MutS2